MYVIEIEENGDYFAINDETIVGVVKILLPHYSGFMQHTFTVDAKINWSNGFPQILAAYSSLGRPAHMDEAASPVNFGYRMSIHGLAMLLWALHQRAIMYPSPLVMWKIIAESYAEGLRSVDDMAKCGYEDWKVEQVVQNTLKTDPGKLKFVVNLPRRDAQET